MAEDRHFSLMKFSFFFMKKMRRSRTTHLDYSVSNEFKVTWNLTY